MHRLFASCAVLSLGIILFTQARISSHVVSHVTNDHTITYECPDTSLRTIRYEVGEDMVAYVKPSLVFPFDPVDISQQNPRLTYVGLMCAGMCALWAYVMHLAALKAGN